jgi:hypothetical protein
MTIADDAPGPVGDFGFLDATSTDTPIFDASVRDDIFELAPSFGIRDRLQKADAFRKYMETQWHLSNINVNYFDLISVCVDKTAALNQSNNSLIEKSNRDSAQRDTHTTIHRRLVFTLVSGRASVGDKRDGS